MGTSDFTHFVTTSPGRQPEAVCRDRLWLGHVVPDPAGSVDVLQPVNCLQCGYKVVHRSEMHSGIWLFRSNETERSREAVQAEQAGREGEIR